MPTVTLYTKPGLLACATRPREALERVRARRPFDFAWSTSPPTPELHERYGERIPVVPWTGSRQLFEYQRRTSRRCDRR